MMDSNKEFEAVDDPIVTMGMPGCFVAPLAFNSAARKYFKRYGAVERRTPLCETWKAPSAVLDFFCPFETAFYEAQKGQPWGPGLVAFKYGPSNGTRTYDLFVAHLLPANDKEVLSFRLLPLPSSVVQLVTHEVYATPRLTPGEYLDPIADGIAVTDRFGTLQKRSGILQADAYKPTDSDQQRLLTSRQIFNQALHEILVEQRSLSGVWARTQEKLGGLADHIPQAARHLFEKPDSTLTEIKHGLQHAWTHVLDAPVLQLDVLPKLWNALTDDHTMRYLPKGKDQDVDRLQYLRALLPLSELVKRDRYLNWLPLAPDWDVDNLRAEMY
jgi:hypothetical protein